MQGMRDYLPEQHTTPLHKAISKVQEQHQSEPNFSDSLTVALYKFQVSSSLYIQNLFYTAYTVGELKDLTLHRTYGVKLP